MVIQRDGKRKTLKAVLERMEDEPLELARTESPTNDWGFDAQELTPRLAEQLALEDTSGVVVTDVEPDGSGDAAGLQRGDVILEVNRKAVNSRRDLTKQLDEDDDTAVLLVRRGDGTLYIPLERE